MNRADILRMGRQAGAFIELAQEKDLLWLERFADLVAAAERENTNNAYKERNQLVALLSTVFPSGKAKTAIDGWDEAWHGCVYIDFPWGQASWHYHTDDGWMFENLPPYTKQWDGHTTEAKYAAIANAIRARGQA